MLGGEREVALEAEQLLLERVVPFCDCSPIACRMRRFRSRMSSSKHSFFDAK